MMGPLLLGSHCNVEAGTKLSSPSSSTPSRSSSDPGAQPFLKVAENIPLSRQITFTTLKQLKSFLDKSALKDTTVRILVRGIAEDKVDECIRKHPLRRHMRVWLQLESHLGIITLLSPSLYHDVTSRLFTQYMGFKVPGILGHGVRDVIPLGSSRFRSTLGKRSKEADEAFMCRTRSGVEGFWPNVVFEVGYSEALTELRLDAQWWLLNSGGKTTMVVVVDVNKSPEKMHIEVWKMNPNPNSTHNTRGRPSNIPTQVNTIDIDESLAVSPPNPNTSLIIPYGDLFDVPNPNGTDITFTSTELANIAEDVFKTARVAD